MAVRNTIDNRGVAMATVGAKLRLRKSPQKREDGELILKRMLCDL